jgi:hypothetical protein
MAASDRQEHNMGGIKRKLERLKEKNAEKEMKQKLSMFDRLPDECLSCEKAFDKKDRSMVESWRVVVREKEKKVNLYCPECWDFAQKIVLEALGNEKEE